MSRVHFRKDFQSLQDYDVKMPSFTFCGARDHKAMSFFFFSGTLIQSSQHRPHVLRIIFSIIASQHNSYDTTTANVERSTILLLRGGSEEDVFERLLPVEERCLSIPIG